jgi:hypothetical protein
MTVIILLQRLGFGTSGRTVTARRHAGIWRLLLNPQT